MHGKGDGGQTGIRAPAGIDGSFLPRTLLDKPIDDTLSKPGMLVIPLLKQLIAIAALQRTFSSRTFCPKVKINTGVLWCEIFRGHDACTALKHIRGLGLNTFYATLKSA